MNDILKFGCGKIFFRKLLKLKWTQEKWKWTQEFLPTAWGLRRIKIYLIHSKRHKFHSLVCKAQFVVACPGILPHRRPQLWSASFCSYHPRDIPDTPVKISFPLNIQLLKINFEFPIVKPIRKIWLAPLSVLRSQIEVLWNWRVNFNFI